MEGRHIGLDFYDLLIEAIEAAVEATKPLKPSVEMVQSGVKLQGEIYDLYSIRDSAILVPGRYLVTPGDRMVRFREHWRIGSAELPGPQAQVMAALVGGC